MHLWLFRISLLLFLLAACGRDKQTPPAAAAIEANFNSAIKTGSLDSAFESASLQLDQLRHAPDSLAAYICCCYNLHDSVVNRASQPWHWQQAKQLLHRIILLQEKAASTNPQLYVKAIYNWAEYQYRRINPDMYNDTAARFFEQALLLNKQYKALDSSSLRYANRALGIYYNKLGDPKKALLYADREKELFEAITSGKTLVGNAINRAIALREMNQPDLAMAAATEGTRVTGAAPDRLANAWTELSEAQLAKGRPADAEKSVRTALHILDTLKTTPSSPGELLIRKGMALFQLGRLQAAQQKYESAIQALQQAEEQFRLVAAGNSISRNAGKVCNAIGYDFAALKQYDSALHYFRRSLAYTVPGYKKTETNQLPPVSSLYPENTIMEAMDGLAAVLETKYREKADDDLLQQAVQCYELAFAVEKKLLPGISYDASLLRLTRQSRRRSDKAIEACYILYGQGHPSEWAAKAFLFAEMSKAVVLQESVKRNTIAATLLNQDPNWLKVQQFEKQVAYFETALAENTNDTSQQQGLQNQLATAESNLLEARAALGVYNEAYRQAMQQTDSLSVEIVQRFLPDEQTALVEYFAGDSATYYFGLAKGTAPVFSQTGDSLAADIRHLLAYFTDKNAILNDPAGYQDAAFQLYNAAGLPAPAGQQITRLIIIPDGPLSFVPFDALVTGKVNAVSPGGFQYLVKQQQVSMEYSAAIMLKQMDRKKSSAGPMVCFAPVFANQERKFTPLLHTREEVQQVKTQHPGGRYFLEQQATSVQFRQQVQQAGIIHIATHASADTAGGRQPVIEFIDSSLYLTDIYAMHISPKLVVLSACETGIGHLDKSEGVLSLARGFYYAGAQNIITSLWAVDDKSTAGLLSAFYRQAGNGSYAAALQQAKLQYLSSAPVTYASPYYWAGFVHIGYQPPAARGASLPLRWLFVPLLLALLLFGWLRLRN